MYKRQGLEPLDQRTGIREERDARSSEHQAFVQQETRAPSIHSERSEIREQRMLILEEIDVNYGGESAKDC